MVSAVRRFDQALLVGNVQAANDNLGPAILEWRRTGGSPFATQRLRIRRKKWKGSFPDRHFPPSVPRGRVGDAKPKSSGAGGDKLGGVDGTRAFGHLRQSLVKKPSEQGFRAAVTVPHPFGMNESATILVFPRRPGETIQLKPHFVTSDAYARMNEVVAGRLERNPVRVLGEAVTWPLRPQNTIKWLCLEGSRSVIAEGLTDADLVAFRAAGIPCIRNDLLVVAAANPRARGQSSDANPMWWKLHVGDLQESKRGEGVLIAFPDTGFSSDTYPEIATRIAKAWHYSGTLPLKATVGPAIDKAADCHGTRVTFMASEIANKSELLICRALKQDEKNRNIARISNLTETITEFKYFAQDCNKPIVICFALSFLDRDGRSANESEDINSFKYALVSALCETPVNNSSYGMVVVAAIGNTSDQSSNHPTLPGALELVIGVGSHNRDCVAEGTCVGPAADNPDKPKPDFYAPGIDVGIPGLGAKNGTSFAAAVLAGIVAVRISDHMSLIRDAQRLHEL